MAVGVFSYTKWQGVFIHFKGVCQSCILLAQKNNIHLLCKIFKQAALESCAREKKQREFEEKRKKQIDEDRVADEKVRYLDDV